MLKNKIGYYAEVVDQKGTTNNLESNINFKKMTKQGSHLGSLMSSLELRGYFDSLDSGLPIKSKSPYPLLTYPFMDFIESFDIKELNFIEFGSGHSTLYFKDKFNTINSYENNKQWFEEIRKLIKFESYYFIETIDLESGNFTINTIDSEKTIVLIDAACNRFELTKNLLKKISPSYFILDNSEWYRNTSNLIISKDYLEIPFWGFKNSEHWESCTSLFIKVGKKLPLRNDRFPPPLSREKINLWDMQNIIN